MIYSFVLFTGQIVTVEPITDITLITTPRFFDTVDETEDIVPENEVYRREARAVNPAWEITAFVKFLKMQYSKLSWIPVNARQLISD